MVDCPECGMRDDDWFLCRRKDCATKREASDFASLEAENRVLRARLETVEAENSRIQKALDEKVPLYHPRRRRAEVRFAVAWLLHRARQTNDPHAQQILNAAAYSLGQEGEPIPAIRNLEPRHD